jgi:hypothetical protein
LAWGGFVIGTVTPILSLSSGFGDIYAFGLVFGPLMAMFFRVIAGDWRGGMRRGGDIAPVSSLWMMPRLARISRTQ